MVSSISQNLITQTSGIEDRPIVLLKHKERELAYRRPVGDVNDVPKSLPDKKVFDLTNPPQFVKNSEDLKLLLATCQKMGLVREFFMEVIAHDTDYFQQYIPANKAPIVHFSPIGLSECGCLKANANRLVSNLRYAFEKQVTAHILTILPDKAQTVKVISMGSGRLLQDWKLIGLLLREGYNAICWIVVDPINNNNPCIEKLRSFCSSIRDAQIEIFSYTHISEVEARDVHAVLAIDFVGNAWDDLLESYTFLKEGGKLFYAGGRTIFEVSSEGVELTLKDPELLDICEEMHALEAKSDGMHLACYGHWSLAAYAISVLQTYGVISLHLSLEEEEEASSVKKLFAVFFPKITMTVEVLSEQELDIKAEETNFTAVIS